MASKIAGEKVGSAAEAAGKELELVAEGLATVKQAEQFLSVSRAKVYSLMDAGELRYAKLGKSRRIPWQALREYAANCLRAE